MKSGKEKKQTDKVSSTAIILLVLISLVILTGLAAIVCFPDQWADIKNRLKGQTAEAVEQSDVQPDNSSIEDTQSAESSSAEQEAVAEQIDFSALQPGDTISFGNYEQDGDKSNRAEPIEWLVLDKTEDRLLVISQYILDCQQYNTSYDTSVTWETCTLRSWLNNQFLNKTFSADEIERIAVTDTEKNIQDKIFLLSKAEIDRYYASDQERMCSPAVNVKLREKIYVNPEDHCSWWWLRSSGLEGGLAINVVNNGTIYTNGHYVNDDNIGVRPAMWININEK